MCARWGDYSKQQPHRGDDIAVTQAGGHAAQGWCGPPRTCRGLFTLITQALNLEDSGPGEGEQAPNLDDNRQHRP